MPWIESHTVLRRHRKLKELSGDLRLKPVYTMGHLHALWHSALEQQEDGDLSAWSDTFISSEADFPGDAERFVQLLQKHKWLDGKLIHDWLNYAGRYLKAKYRSSNPARLIEIWAKHGKVYLESDYSPTKDRPPNQPNQPNQPTNQPIIGDDDESDGTAAGPDPANQLAVALGIETRVGETQRGDLRRLISIDGYGAALKACRLAQAAGANKHKRMVAYATTVIDGEKAKRDLSGVNGSAIAGNMAALERIGKGVGNAAK